LAADRRISSIQDRIIYLGTEIDDEAANFGLAAGTAQLLLSAGQPGKAVHAPPREGDTPTADERRRCGLRGRAS